MLDDLDTTSLGADLDAALGEQAGPELSDADREAGWRIKPKDAEAEAPESLSETLDRTAAEQEAAAPVVDAGKAWEREWKALADQALSGNGVEWEKRHEQGLSRREAVRRLFTSEAALREDPPGGLERIASAVAGRLDDQGRMAAAARVLAALGLSDLNQASERRELEAFRSRDRGAAESMQQAVTGLQPRVAEFAKAHADFDQLRPTMHGLALAAAQSGQRLTLEDAYAQARRAHALEAPQAAQGQAADDARRSKVAAARNAGTPRTASVQTPPPDLSKMGLGELLEHQFAAMGG